MIDLDAAVRAALGAGARVVHTAPSVYATSHVIEDVVVHLADGRTRTLLLKRLDELLPGASAAKPQLVRDVHREIDVYRHLLPRAAIGTAECVAAGDRWLLLEKPDGTELYQHGDLEMWRAVARWLPGAHERLTASLDGAPRRVRDRLLRLDADWFSLWPRRVTATLERTTDRTWARAVSDRYDLVVDRLAAAPATVLHGELYASNVLVCGELPSPRVCAVDWEMASLGPAVIDLAALVSGSWSEDARAAIVSAYCEIAPVDDADLAAARLHLAMQWLGWSPTWQAPADHAHDWLTDARSLSALLGLT